MRLALDVDGVLADLVGIWLKVYREETGRTIDRGEVKEWEFWSKYGVTRQQFAYIMTKCWSRWPEIEMIEPDAAEDVLALHQYGQVDIVTQRPAKTIGDVQRWLKHHGIRYRRLTWVPLNGNKASFGYDLYIDDSPRVVLEVAKRGKLALLYNQPWNSEVTETKSITRINSLDACVEYLERLTR